MFNTSVFKEWMKGKVWVRNRQNLHVVRDVKKIIITLLKDGKNELFDKSLEI